MFSVVDNPGAKYDHADELQNEGTINHTAAYPREIVRRSLELGAASIILVHNHPSGDATPSKADIDLTNQVIAAANALELKVHDHLICLFRKCSVAAKKHIGAFFFISKHLTEALLNLA